LLSLLESDLSFSRKLCVKRLLFLFVELSALSLELILEARSVGRHERKTFLGCQIVLPVGSHLLHSDVFHLFHENSSGSRLFSVVFFHFRDFSKPLRSFVVIEASLDFLELFLIFSLDFLEFLDTLLEELVQIDGQEHLSSEISEELGAEFRLAHAFELLARLSQLLGLLLFSFSKSIQSIPIALFFVGDFLLLVSFVARFLLSLTGRSLADFSLALFDSLLDLVSSILEPVGLARSRLDVRRVVVRSSLDRQFFFLVRLELDDRHLEHSREIIQSVRDPFILRVFSRSRQRIGRHAVVDVERRGIRIASEVDDVFRVVDSHAELANARRIDDHSLDILPRHVWQQLDELGELDGHVDLRDLDEDSRSHDALDLLGVERVVLSHALRTVVLQPREDLFDLVLHLQRAFVSFEKLVESHKLLGNNFQHTVARDHVAHERATSWSSLELEQTRHLLVLLDERVLDVEHFAKTVLDSRDRDRHGRKDHHRGEGRELLLREVLAHIAGQLEELVACASVEQMHVRLHEDDAELGVEFRELAGMRLSLGDVHQVVNIFNSFERLLPEFDLDAKVELRDSDVQMNRLRFRILERNGDGGVLAFCAASDLIQVASERVGQSTELVFSVVFDAERHRELGDILVQSLDWLVVSQQIEAVSVRVPEELDPRDENLDVRAILRALASHGAQHHVFGRHWDFKIFNLRERFAVGFLACVDAAHGDLALEREFFTFLLRLLDAILGL